MQSKLTLRMDDRLIRGAKEYAARAGKPLSLVVAEYFSVITSRDEFPSRLTPTVSALKGALKGGGGRLDGLSRPSRGKAPLKVLFDTNVLLDFLLDRPPSRTSRPIFSRAPIAAKSRGSRARPRSPRSSTWRARSWDCRGRASRSRLFSRYSVWHRSLERSSKVRLPVRSSISKTPSLSSPPGRSMPKPS